jgi:hypothetical protein
LRDQKKSVVINYLERWNRGFWIDAEKVSKEITTTLAKKLSAELGIGVKLRADVPYKYCYDEHATIQAAELLPDTKIVVHPMLASALGVGPSR